MIKIYPYIMGSESVKKLKSILGGHIIKLENSRYRYRTSHNIINWGNSRRPSWMTTDVPVLNKPESVAVASNKYETLLTLQAHGVSTVEFTDSKLIAEDWLSNGDKVFVRHSLTGHSGHGIEVVNNNENVEQILAISNAQRMLEDAGLDDVAELLDNSYSDMLDVAPELPDAPLYTRGIENNGEYRVHVFNGSVILYQKKSRRVDDDGVDIPDEDESDVRNLASNWIYRTDNLRRLERIEQLAINAVTSLGLDFGAVDIIKDGEGNIYVLEVNSAPGLRNDETARMYTEAITSYYHV